MERNNYDKIVLGALINLGGYSGADDPVYFSASRIWNHIWHNKGRWTNKNGETINLETIDGLDSLNVLQGHLADLLETYEVSRAYFVNSVNKVINLRGYRPNVAHIEDLEEMPRLDSSK